MKGLLLKKIKIRCQRLLLRADLCPETNTSIMRKTLLIIALFYSLPLFAQEEELKKNTEKLTPAKADTVQGWKTGGMGSLTFAQVSLTNWAAGGQNSIAFNGALNLFANYKKGHSTWDNNLDLGFGMVRQGLDDVRKSDDRIDFSSKYGRQAFKSKYWYYAAMVNFRTQFAPGYTYPNDSVQISRFMAPAYTTIAMGLDYKPIPNLTLFLAPVTGKITMVNDQTLADAGAFGVAKAEYDTAGTKTKDGSRIRYEFGGYLKFTYKADIGKNATYTTRLDLFSNYIERPQNIDIMWENNLVVKVGKYIGVTFSTLLLYDDDVEVAVDSNDDGVNDAMGPRIQFRQIFGVGFSYKFAK